MEKRERFINKPTNAKTRLCFVECPWGKIAKLGKGIGSKRAYFPIYAGLEALNLVVQVYGSIDLEDNLEVGEVALG